MGTNAKGLNVLKHPSLKQNIRHQTRRGGWTETDRQTDGQTDRQTETAAAAADAAAVTFPASNLLAFALKQPPGPVKCVVFRHHAVIFFRFPQCVSKCVSELLDPDDAAPFQSLKKKK